MPLDRERLGERGEGITEYGVREDIAYTLYRKIGAPANKTSPN